MKKLKRTKDGYVRDDDAYAVEIQAAIDCGYSVEFHWAFGYYAMRRDFRCRSIDVFTGLI